MTPQRPGLNSVPWAVQTLEDPHLLPKTPRWVRMGSLVSRVSSVQLVSYWIYSPVLVPGTEERCYNRKTIALASLRFIIAWPLLCILMAGFQSLAVDEGYSPITSELRGHGLESPRGAVATQPQQRYADDVQLDSVPSSPVAAQTETAINLTTVQQSERGDSVPPLIRPTYLCLVNDFEKRTFETVKVSEYLKDHGDNVDIEFVFVSYTRVQFRVATDDEITNYTYSSEKEREANRILARNDRRQLINWGIDAARRAGKRAFWLDFECIRNQDGLAQSTSNSDEVYQICDIIRVAHSMIIAIGPPTEDKISQGTALASFDPANVTPWLRQWGSRLWTLPELLLCPIEHRIQLYITGDTGEPRSMAKRNFAERAWNDAGAVQELVNHFEGTATLTKVQLIEAAFKCFSRRKTDQFSQGDIAYAIMGLFPLRQRPAVNAEDSGFQAFARLALENECGAFLNRLICINTPAGAPWHDTTDSLGADFRDIHATSTVTNILGTDTVLLDDVAGAIIEWDNLNPSSTPGSFNPLNFFSAAYLRSVVFVSLIGYGVRLLAGRDLNDFPSTICLALALLFIVIGATLAPTILTSCSRSKAEELLGSRLIGIEGHPSAAAIEKHICGFNHGRFKATNLEPYSDMLEHQQSTQSPAGKYAFTLVETRMMTVTHFYSAEPPAAVLILGEVNGAYREILCSYDTQQHVFRRQSVLRTSRRGIGHYSRASNVLFSLGLVSQSLNHAPVNNHSGESHQADGRVNDASEAVIDQEALKEKDWPGCRRVELLFIYLFMVTLLSDSNWWYGPSQPGFQFGAIFYAASFTLAQPASYFLLSRVSILRCWSSIALLKGLHFIPLIRTIYIQFNAVLLLYAVQGLIRGLELSCMVAIVWSCWKQVTHTSLFLVHTYAFPVFNVRHWSHIMLPADNYCIISHWATNRGNLAILQSEDVLQSKVGHQQARMYSSVDVTTAHKTPNRSTSTDLRHFYDHNL
ncbi:uncharacterized protein FIESC28_01124 [Fusarium coffeatum]|uniref:Heterokaryon incompatibility domain-containing protein n=1 Tax=Fusarium coffeatum TaxID=231269 RepID=A0A366SBR0_9HYPO|nr:uncharacterized protein FIESC28_01124 [Fusarium coffeatum]RBR26096.1 hypothetical protein FIESC28_01124 [Fusarium coffeatum]